jgi:predicted RND superfamily exporter protein/acyl carrier protein
VADKPESFHEERLPESAFSMRFARWIMDNRFATLMTLIFIALFFSYPLINGIYYTVTGESLPVSETRFRLDTRVRDQWPEHDFIHSQDKFAGRFGTASYISLAVVAKDGDIYDREFLEKIKRITYRVDEAPAVNHYQVNSIAHPNLRVIVIEPDGSIDPQILMDEVPQTEEEIAEFRETVHQNPGRIYGFYAARNDSAAQVTAGFITHRLDNADAYRALFDHVMAIKAEEEADGTVDIFVSGVPVLRGWIYVHAFEITLFLLATIVALFFLLLSYFRRLHGVAIPMVAGLATAIWGMGFTAWIGIALDPLILVIPLLITARSISHTIQMAERFFEDFEMECEARERQFGHTLDESEVHDAKVETATTAMAKLMLPGMLGIITDAAGLLVIYITTIQQMRNLASFGSFWVIAIIFNVILLHPIMIAYLPPPHEAKHYTPRFMNWILSRVGNLTTHRSKYAVVGVVAAFFAFATYYVLFNSTIGENRPGTPLLWPSHPFNLATAEISERFGGLDQFVIFVDGDQRGSSSDGFVLQKMEALERHMKKYADPGASVSLVNFITGYWKTNHYGDPKWGFIPDSPQTVGAIIFQLMQSGTPGALRPFITDEREDSNVTFFFPDHRGRTIVRAVHFAEEFIHANPMGKFSVRLIEDDDRLMNGIYYMIGPLLPPRHESMHVYVTEFSEDQQEILGYDEQEIVEVGEWSQPPPREEVEKNVINMIARMGRKKKADVTLEAHLRDDLDIDPDTLGKIALKLSSDHDYRIETVRLKAKAVPAERWTTVESVVNDVIERGTFYVDYAWDGGETGAKAQTIRYCRTYCGYELWVQNEKFKDKSWNPQPTGSWTRGAEFVMAGGLMGILAAVNDEVERGHVANILLIFLVVFTFVSVSYRSATAGLVIVFSLATGTMLSLFYMALTGTGLNINTLPVQSVGVGIGVDYAIYITDRIRQEASWAGNLDEGIRRAIRTTGMAVTFTATTLVGGIIAWSFSNLRFQAEMARLLSILMVVNMVGAILLVPSWFSILRPGFFAASLSARTEQQNEVEAERRVATGQA